MNLKDVILGKTRQGLDVFRHYIGFPFILKKPFRNPLYQDTKASCYVYFNNKTGYYMLKDFGAMEFSGDCFWFVSQLNGLDVRKDFVKVLRLINDDMRLMLDFNPRKDERPLKGTELPKLTTPQQFANTTEREKESTPPKAQVTTREFTAAELRFWAKYGINVDTLQRYKVKSGLTYQSVNKDGKTYSICSTPTEPMFVYTTSDCAVKIYRPASKLRFLYGNAPEHSYVFGLELLPSRGHMVFITGGEKDVMSLAAHGFNAICFNSETAIPSEQVIKSLHGRFKHIVLLYDMDQTGIDCSKKMVDALREYKVQRMELPLSGAKGEKDISDYFAKGKSGDDFNLLIRQFITELYRDNAVTFKTCELDYAKPPSESKTIVEINEVPLGTCDNLFCITGGEGVGKSNFVSAIVSGALVGNTLDESRTLGLTISPNKTRKAVLMFDTEQSERQLYKNVRKTLKRAFLDNKPPFFHAYHLLTLTRKERLELIRNTIDMNFHEHQGIHIVIIDGVADLVRSANDEIESIEIVDELYRLAGFYHTCIVCVLHFVPNGIKLRGHIGSELQRKAAGILSIEKEDNQEQSVVKAIKVRDGSPLDIPMMLFGWDKREDMFMFQGIKSKEDKERRKQKELRTVALGIFKTHDTISYSDVCQEIMKQMNVQERTAKDYVKYMRESGIIDKNAFQMYQLKL